MEDCDEEFTMLNCPAANHTCALNRDEARRSIFERHWMQMTALQRERCRVPVALLRELRVEVAQRVAERDSIALGGQWQYESSHSMREADAKRLLRLRKGDTAKGIPVTSQVGRLKYDEARDDLIAYHAANGRDTTKLEARIKKHLTPFFTGKKLVDISVAVINAYVAKRLKDEPKPANATINRELAWLKHMFRLAVDAGKLMTRPKIKLLVEDNARQGFFEHEQYESMLRHLPEDLRPVVRFAYITGWRVKSEVLTLEWRHVDLKAGEVRLEPGTTKNKEGRTFPFTIDLKALIDAQHAEHERLKKKGKVVPWVFFRLVANGRGGPLRPKPITSFIKAFKTACRKAGCPGRIPHDLRRTAVRNLERAGIPRSVAMKLTGHKTESVYRRYAIADERDLRVAVERLNAMASAR
jgi:integrase